jgi:hypothetical protein
MAIDFPASPTLNDVFTVGNVTYVWDGTKWTASVTGGISLDKIEEGNTSAEVIDTGSDGRFVVTTEGTERLRVTDTGRVGIGTASPNGNTNYGSLDLNGSAGGEIFFSSGGVSRGNIFNYSATPANLGIAATDASGQIIFNTGGYTERVRIDSSGRLGIGTSSPSGPLDVVTGSEGAIFRFSAASTYLHILPEAANGNVAIRMRANSGAAPNFQLRNDAGSNLVTITNGGSVGIGTTSPTGIFEACGSSSYFRSAAVAGTFFQITAGAANGVVTLTANANSGAYPPLLFNVGGGERARIDTSGRLLVGTSSAPTGGTYAINSLISVKGFAGSSTGVGIFNISGGMAASSVVSGTEISVIACSDASGNEYATIKCVGDGTGASGDYPGRLVFSTTADGASSPTERMRISSTGQTNFYYPTINNYAAFMDATNASFGGTVLGLDCNRAATDSYYFLNCSSGDGGDNEFNLRGGGSGYCDGSWNGGGADYAEYFEWSDSNPNEEDRRGISVVLDGDKIRKAQAGEDPIGVISGNPSMVGDAAWNKWSGKYLRDEFGTYIQEDYEVVNDEGETVVQQRRKLNPDYDSNQEYTPREQRPEWDCVGLMGKLRIRKGQATGSRWIKMRDISDSVEEWLVR